MASPPPVSENAAKSKPRLPALAGLRLVAALHIYLFHLKLAHDGGLITFDFFQYLNDRTGSWWLRAIASVWERGYTSTGLFFVLSGFLLAYANVRVDGRLRSSAKSFWYGRFVRLYPLYFVSLLVMIPVPAMLKIDEKPTSPADTLAMAATNLTLVQAWFPAYAIKWNPPAWALSAFAAFYVAFPLIVPFLGRLKPRALLWTAGISSVAAWLPSILYWAFDPEKNAATAVTTTLGGFWLNFLRFCPLVWLPQFLAGAATGKWFLDRTSEGRAEQLPRWLNADAVLVLLVLVLAYAPVPYVFLRHGFLTPLFVLLLIALASGRGTAAWFLSGKFFQHFVEAGFALFAMQTPIGVWYAIFLLPEPHGSTPQMLGMIACTLGSALSWAHISARWKAKKKAAA